MIESICLLQYLLYAFDLSEMGLLCIASHRQIGPRKITHCQKFLGKGNALEYIFSKLILYSLEDVGKDFLNENQIGMTGCWFVAA